MASYPFVVLGGTGAVKGTDGFDLSTVAVKDSSGGLNAINLTLQGLLSYYVANAVALTKSASFSFDGTATFWQVDCTTGARTGTLPTAVASAGRWYLTIKKDSAANNYTITTPDSTTINGAATLVLTSQWQFALIWCDGTVWYAAHN